jgi:predicted metal-dependent hydrolase
VPSLTQHQLQFDAEPSRAVAGTAQRVVLSERVLHYRFVRARRRTIGIIVRRGQVEARAPRHVAIAEVESFIRKKERWIAKRLAESTREPPPFRWVEGEALPVLGHAARLTASPGATTVRLTDDRLALPLAAFARWRELTIAWLRAAALDLFRDRIRHYANSLGVREPSLGLSNAQTQWGSCRRTRGGAGRVLINWRLVHLPPHLTDYVVAHELAHLREPNHSPRFWTIVAQLFPDYLSARRELARLGRALPML